MTKKTISAAEVPGFELLTPREQAFVQHPHVYKDPKRAALESGYSSSTIEKRAHSMRQRLMRFIQPVFTAQLAEIGVDRRRIEEELAAIAFTVEDEFKESIDIEMKDGGFQSVVVWKDPRTLPVHMRRAIKFVEWGSVTTADDEEVQSDRPTRVVLYSKEKALHELAGLFSDVAPKNPADEQQRLFDNLDPADKEMMIRLHVKAARRAAENSPIEGEHANRNEAVRRLKAPSPPRAPQAKDPDKGRALPRDDAADSVESAPLRGVRVRKERSNLPPSAPRRARPKSGGGGTLIPDEDSDAGYRELPG